MTTTVNRSVVKEVFDSNKNQWISGVEIRELLGYEGPQKNISNATSGLFTSGMIDKRKRVGGGGGVEFKAKTRSYKPRTTQEDLPLQELTRDVPAPKAAAPLMNAEFEILSTSLGKIMADNNNMRAALKQCRDAIDNALQG